MKHRVLILSGLVCVTACQDPNAPKEENFKAAIDAYLVQKGQLCLNNETWPVEIDRKNEFAFGAMSQSKRLDALVSQGLLTTTEATSTKPASWGRSAGQLTTLTRYTLTDSGRSFLKRRDHKVPDKQTGESGTLCYGREAVERIEKWDAPVSLGDYQATVVRYHYKIVDLAPWAQSADVQAAFPAVKQSVSGAGTRLESHGVHLTSEGWEANGLD